MLYLSGELHNLLTYSPISDYVVFMRNEPEMIIHLVARVREKANRFITAELSERDMGGLKPVHGDVLFALFRYGNLSMKAIAEIVDRKKSTVTTLVEKIIKAGYAEKNTDDTDNRSFIISLTDKGRDLKGDLVDISDKLIQKVYKDMPMEEREQLVRSLNKINEAW